jgi:hypothetical protein
MTERWVESGKLVFHGGQWVYCFTTYAGAKAHANLMNACSYKFEYRVEKIDNFYFIGIYDEGSFWTYH